MHKQEFPYKLRSFNGKFQKEKSFSAIGHSKKEYFLVSLKKASKVQMKM